MARLMKKEQLEQAIAKTTKMLSRSGVPVTQRGASAYCAWHPVTGKLVKINIPMLPDNPTEEFLDAIQGFIDHECAHVYYTDSVAGIAAEKASVVAQKSRNAATILHNMANIVEDVRIEALLPKELPGSEHNLNKVRQYIIDTVWRPEMTKLIPKAAAGDKEARRTLRGNALIPFLRGLGGQRVCMEFIEDMGLVSEFDVLMRAIPDLKERIADMKSVEDATQLAELIVLAITEPSELKKPPQPKPEDQDEGDDSALGDLDDADQSDADDGRPDEIDDSVDQPGEASGGGHEDDGEDEEDGSEDEEADADDNPEGEDEDGDESVGDDDDADDADGEEESATEDQLGDAKGKALPTLKEAMRRLSPTQRRVLFNYNTKRLSIAEISAKLGMTETDVEQTLKSARRRLSVIMSGGK